MLNLLLTIAVACALPADDPKPAPKSPTFKAPDGWTAVEPPKSAAVIPVAGRFKAGTADDQVTVIVMAAAGGLTANVNRWRGQLKLEALDGAGVKETLKPVKVGGAAGHLFDATGGEPARRIVGVVVEHGGDAWFIKMDGSAAAVEKQRKAFDAFLASIAFLK